MVTRLIFAGLLLWSDLAGVLAEDRHLDPDEATGDALTNRARQACSEFGTRCADALDVQVVLEDVNGPSKGGVDKHCHIKVRGRNRLSLDATATRPEIWQAMDAAFRRLDALLVRSNQSRKPHHGPANLLQDGPGEDGSEFDEVDQYDR